MLKPIQTLLFILLITSGFLFGQEQNQFKIHSHNDYKQAIPFWNAYGNGLESIEADIFLKNNQLYVTHHEDEIKEGHTLESLYLKPLELALSLELGKIQKLQFLLDLKSEAITTLAEVVRILEQYPNLTYHPEITFVISGNRPSVEQYTEYPDFIFFDYQTLEFTGNTDIWDKVALISVPFQKFSKWNGKGRLTHTDLELVTTAIAKAHAMKKPFRFWGCPDSKTAWKTFANLGVDFINTDKPFEASNYLSTLNHRVYQNTLIASTYSPSYLSDKKKAAVKNVILLIGDGNGLSQISAATLANGGSLTLTQLKSIGLLKTQSADDFTTDSAAAGTALATGQKTNNRAIGLDVSDKPIENMVELLAKSGFNTGCITTDEITGATPAAFYAHQKDRDYTDAIQNDLLQSPLSLFIGGGKTGFKLDSFKGNFTILENIDAVRNNKAAKIGYFLSDGSVPSLLKGRGNQLAEATKNGLEYLHAKNKPFFLMVEGAQIDSYGHHNDTAGIVTEGIDFDRAITEAIRFADKHDNTLVIITADHETSGFSIPQGNLNHKTIEGDFTTDDHTATMVPIFAYGPQSDLFSGVYENTQVFHKIKEALKIK